MSFRQKLLQRLQKSGDAPEEHTRVPVEIAGGQIFFGGGKVRLFRKALYGEDRRSLSGDGISLAFDVAVAGFRVCGWDAEDYHVTGFARFAQSGANNFAIT